MELVDGGGYCERNRDGPGSTRMYRYGKAVLYMAMSHVTVGILHRFTTPLSSYKGRIADVRELETASMADIGSPNSSYNEHICISKLGG